MNSFGSLRSALTNLRERISTGICKKTQRLNLEIGRQHIQTRNKPRDGGERREMEGANQTLTESEIRRIFQAKCDESSPAQVAREFKISRAYVSDILKGNRHISKRVAGKLGFAMREHVVRYYTRD